MAYVTRLVGKEEKLIGVGRLHYIYVIRGAMWLLFMTLSGLALSYITGMGLSSMSAYFDTMSEQRAFTLTGIMLNFQHYTMLFCVGVGVMFFLMYLVKYMVTEVGLTSRRVIHKEGFIFVKVSNIDLEEIRGENLDTGWFGRMMNYGYLLLDCRFLGDVRLPALNKAEAFLKALHYHRSHTQDAVSVVVGKGNPAPVQIVGGEGDDGSNQNIEVQQEAAAAPAPEQPVQPVQPVAPPAQPAQPPVTPQPEVPVTPPQPQTPPSTPSTPAQPQPPQPEVEPQPQQPQPEIQPQREIPQPSQPEILPDPGPQTPDIQIPTQAQAAPAKQADADMIAQVVSKVVPELVQEMKDKGLINGSGDAKVQAPANPVDTEEELLAAFDDAAFKTEARSVEENAKKRSLH